MTFKEFENTILSEMENANNCDEVVQVINHSFDQVQDEERASYFIIIFLHILQNDLEKLDKEEADSDRRRSNIHCALMYLKQIDSNRKRIEN